MTGSGKTLRYRITKNPKSLTDLVDFCERRNIKELSIEVSGESETIMTNFNAETGGVTSPLISFPIYSSRVVVDARGKKIELDGYSLHGDMSERESIYSRTLYQARRLKSVLEYGGKTVVIREKDV